jgi:imidazolonepropionase-like amidohydrolase
VQHLGPLVQAKKQQVVAGTETVYRLAKKYKLKTEFGTDILFSKAKAERQGSRLAAHSRWYTPADVLVMATSTNARLLGLSGLSPQTDCEPAVSPLCRGCTN